MLIGEPTAEAIKKNIGSAFPGSEVREMEVRGRNLSEGVPRSFTISSNEILEALTDPLNQIVSAVKNALEQTPPELGADIADRGMMLTGGGALLRDLDRLLAEETGLPVLVAEDPLTCVVRGCGIALERMDRLGSIFTSDTRPWSLLRAAETDRCAPCHSGPSALSRLAVFSALALFLMVADARFHITDPLRKVVATVLYPVQWLMLKPVEFASQGSGYFQSLQTAQQDLDTARKKMTEMGQRANQADQLALENGRLRKLMELRDRLQTPAQAAEVIYDTADPYTRRGVLDRG
eukprot:gene20308-40022_t